MKPARKQNADRVVADPVATAAADRDRTTVGKPVQTSQRGWPYVTPLDVDFFLAPHAGGAVST